MLDKSKLPEMSVIAVEDYFQRLDNTPFENSFFLIQSFISRMLCSNRVRIIVPQDEICAFPNLYCLTISPSGTGKDKTVRLANGLFEFMFRDLAKREADFREAEDKELNGAAAKLVEDKKMAKGKTHEYIESRRTRSLFSLVKSNATPEGVAALHRALGKVGFGCVFWKDSEISDTMMKLRDGGPLADLVNIFKEVYDNGDFDPKIIQGVKDATSIPKVPYVAWLHGAIDTEEGQRPFRRMFDLGYARRLILIMNDGRTKNKRSPTETLKGLESASVAKGTIYNAMKDIYERTAVKANVEYGGTFDLTLSDEALLRYIGYKTDCENASMEMPPSAMGLLKDEMANRNWKALKLAAVFHVQEDDGHVISLKTLEMAIGAIESESPNLSRFFRLKSVNTLPEMIIDSIRSSATGTVIKTDFYSEGWFPKNKGGQKRILEENLVIANEILAASNSMILANLKDGRTTEYSIIQIPGHRDETDPDLEVGCSVADTVKVEPEDYRPRRVKFSEFHTITGGAGSYAAGTYRENYKDQKNWNGDSEILILDIDNGEKGHIVPVKDQLTIEAAKRKFSEFTFLISESKSHNREKKEYGVRERFRMVFPIVPMKGVSVAEFKKVMANFFRRHSIDVKGWADLHCLSNPSCLYFPNNEGHYYNWGKLIDWRVYSMIEEREPGRDNHELRSVMYKVSKSGGAICFEEAVTLAKLEGKQTCQCPFHDDAHSSAFFRISEGKDRPGDFFFLCSACNEKKFVTL